MFKKLIIKIFRLNEINDLLIKSKQQQKAVSDKYWKEVRQDEVDCLNRNHLLELQEKDACITMLEEQIKMLKQRERDVDALHFKSKKQIKENYAVSHSIATKIWDFSQMITSIYGELRGITDAVADNKKRIEGN